jgi:hypothetical protein
MKLALALQRPWYQRLWLWLSGLWGARRRYTEGEVAHIAEIGALAAAFARIIDQPVMDQRGKPL